MAIICRPIWLYNEFLPSETECGERDWEYQAFGHYDGVDVDGEPIIFEDGSSFDKIYIKSQEKDNKNYFAQCFYAFHQDKCKEEAFWKEKGTFLYITLLQMDKEKIVDFRSIWENSERVSELAAKLGYENQIQDTKLITYYSLEQSELILLIKCESARFGAEIINFLHQDVENKNKIEIRNSYSILAVKRSVIDSDKLSDLVEKINMVELRIIERYNGSIGLLYNHLQNELKDLEIKRNALLGTEDESITIKDITWERLLFFYKKDTGILCNSNSKAKNFSNAISTKIILDLRDGEEIESIPPEPPSPVLLCDKLLERISEMNTDAKISCETEKRNLYLLTSALRRYEYVHATKQIFSDYIFFPLILPLRMFIHLAKEDGASFFINYYCYMKNMRLCTQNAVKPDRLYLQTTDFNMRYFDTPIKLTLLYNAYIYYLKNALNTASEATYEFLLSPGVKAETEVMELFCFAQKNKHLFLVEIPERQLYNVKLMCIILGHEAAHFVGRDVRMRPTRLNRIIKICSRSMALVIRSYYEYRHDSSLTFEKDKWDDLERNLEQWIHFYLERYKNEQYYIEKKSYKGMISKNEMEDTILFYKDHADHADVLKISLEKVLKEMLSEQGMNFLNFMIQDQFKNEKISYVQKEEFYEEKERFLKEGINRFLDVSNDSQNAVSIQKIVNKIIFWMKECYADMICIMTLQLTLEEYMQSFVTAKNKELQLDETELLIRVAIVVSAMSYPLNEDVYTWRKIDEDKLESQELKDFIKAVLKFCNNYIANEQHIDAEGIIEYPMRVFCDRKILKEIISYIVICRREFGSKIENGKDNNHLKQVRNIYELTKQKDTNNFFESVMQILNRYENDVYKEIADLIKAEEAGKE